MTATRDVTDLALGLAVAGSVALLAVRHHDVGTAARLFDRLERQETRDVERFDPAMLDRLPEPARRYLLHAIQPETPLARAVRLAMWGEIRLAPRQPWLPFHARQILAPPEGFVWNASVGKGVTRFRGADLYAAGRGRVAFRLWDLLPIARAGGPDVARSARGRLAIESIWLPASLLPTRGATWTAIDDQTAQVTVPIDGEESALTLTIAPDGRLRSVAMERWGSQTTDGLHASIPFGADVVAERTFGGYTVPSELAVSWWYGTDHAFDCFRAQVSRATYLPA
jgi:hypothetical protein